MLFYTTRSQFQDVYFKSEKLKLLTSDSWTLTNIAHMKAPQLIHFIIIVALLIQSCRSSKTSIAKTQVSTDEVSLFQNGNETLLNELAQTVEVDRRAFSLRFYNKKYNPKAKEFYSAQIAAFLDKADLDKVKIGMLKEDMSCFKPGTGMAPSRSGKYESLFLTKNAHHYTFYENSESKRLNLLGEFGAYAKLEFEVTGLHYDSKEVKMKNTDINEFYLALLIDKNLNGQIDDGELRKLTIKVKLD